MLIGADDVIIAGHGRVLAAEKLGLAEVPVIVLSQPSESQRQALVIADNRIAENAGLDGAMLKAEIAALFSRRVMNSARASSMTSILFRPGMAVKSNLSRLLTAGVAGRRTLPECGL